MQEPPRERQAAVHNRSGHARPFGTHALIETDVPARLDRLLWSRFHSLTVLALGITWVLDGLI
ncbi:MAG: hypothetical protein ACRET2_16150, partial [Steroidobacteraceae bacterium]